MVNVFTVMAFHIKCNDCSVRRGHNSQFLHDPLSPRWHDTWFDFQVCVCVCMCVYPTVEMSAQGSTCSPMRWEISSLPPRTLGLRGMDGGLSDGMRERAQTPQHCFTLMLIPEKKMVWARKMETFLCRPIKTRHKERKRKSWLSQRKWIYSSFLDFHAVQAIPPVALLCGSSLR